MDKHINEQLKELKARINELSEQLNQKKHILDRDSYSKYADFLAVINDVLCENMISVKSSGHTFMKDAVCIIHELGGRDICFSKDIYPRIAEDHENCSAAKVEHSIRNAIDAAYLAWQKHSGHTGSLMHRFAKKPSNKSFLLQISNEVNSRMTTAALEC